MRGSASNAQHSPPLRQGAARVHVAATVSLLLFVGGAAPLLVLHLKEKDTALDSQRRTLEELSSEIVGLRLAVRKLQGTVDGLVGRAAPDAAFIFSQEGWFLESVEISLRQYLQGEGHVTVKPHEDGLEVDLLLPRAHVSELRRNRPVVRRRIQGHVESICRIVVMRASNIPYLMDQFDENRVLGRVRLPGPSGEVEVARFRGKNIKWLE